VHRNEISLFDTQFDSETGRRIPIPSSIINDVIAALLRFQIICADLGVPGNTIRIIATEATRTAINSDEFRDKIKKATGLTVEMLAKEDEGKVGALGIASSFSDMQGLVMDLGGGSTQISWMMVQGGSIRTSPLGAFSFPYGAAALTRKLEELTAGKSKDDAERALDKFREEMKTNFLDAYKKLEIPMELIEKAKSDGGFPLYLSGGGFRGWGYLLLYQSQVHGHHYPISLITASQHKRRTSKIRNPLRRSQELHIKSSESRTAVGHRFLRSRSSSTYWLEHCRMASKKPIFAKVESGRGFSLKSFRPTYASRIPSRSRLPHTRDLPRQPSASSCSARSQNPQRQTANGFRSQ